MLGTADCRGRLWLSSYQAVLAFFCLTAARNGRIPEIPQPRNEGRGITSAALARPCPLATLGERPISTRITVADKHSGLYGFQVRFGIAEIFCLKGILENGSKVFSFVAARDTFIAVDYCL